MKSQLQKMGYTPEFINEYLETKAAKQRSDMQKGIISLFFKNSDFSIVPKAFNHLKEFVKQRKLAKARAMQAINWMNHPLSVYFRKWKYDQADAENKLKGLSKHELIDKIIADEKQGMNNEEANFNLSGEFTSQDGLNFFLIHKFMGPNNFKPVYKSEITSSINGRFSWNLVSILTSELANEDPEREIRVEFFKS